MSKKKIQKKQSAAELRNKKSKKDSRKKSKKKQDADSMGQLPECLHWEYSIDILASQRLDDKVKKQ